MKKIENQDKLKKIISTILLISWCLLIFYFSSQIGEKSNLSSSHVIDFINKLLNVNLYNFEYSVLIVRKLAHMFLYFVLNLLSINFFKSYKLNNYYKYAFLFCLIYAISDEVHQLFVIERAFRLTDIIIDMLGACIGYILLKLINKLKIK
ncbi:MAG: VanZ family protein [Bacilli bacterium]|nr:VanZ family protein [Bacilli bacterium]